MKVTKFCNMSPTKVVNSPSCNPATPINNKAITATRKEVLPLSLTFKNPTIKPNAKRIRGRLEIVIRLANTVITNPPISDQWPTDVRFTCVSLIKFSL